MLLFGFPLLKVTISQKCCHKDKSHNMGIFRGDLSKPQQRGKCKFKDISQPSCCLFVCLSLMLRDIQADQHLIYQHNPNGEFSLLEFVYTPTTSSSQTRGWAQSLSAPQGCSPRFCSVSINFLAWFPCTRHALFRSALPFGPLLEADVRASWVLGNTTSPDGGWKLERELWCLYKRIYKDREGPWLLLASVPVPLFQRGEGSQIVCLFPAWPCSMACKRTFCGRSDLYVLTQSLAS